MVKSYIAVDLETTGLNPKNNRIIEIGAIRVVDGKEEATFQTFVNPYQKLDEGITELTGIKDEDLMTAPGIEVLIKEFLDFAGKLPLLGHQVLFDYSFLKRAAINQGLTFERTGVDTLKLARKFMPQEEKKNLRAACEYFGISPKESHRALADAQAAHQLFMVMEKYYEDKDPRAFWPQNLIYKVKKDQPASKRQKEHLQDLLKYHKIGLTMQIDHLSRNEISRITDKIIAQYGRI